MKSIFFISLLLISTNSFSMSIKCKFEEVYADKSTQSGFILLKGDLLRYQYDDKQLFTIIHNNNDSYVIRNDNTTIIQKLDNEDKIIQEIMKLSKEYPNTKTNYKSNDYSIKLEKSLISKFYKRIAIIGDKLNLSIYFNNCETHDTPIHYFNYNPLSEYIF